MDKKLDRNICKHCSRMECISLHRGTGIRLSCQNISADDVISEVLSSSILFYDGGGVTFTGGECTLQFEELSYVLRELQNHHINTTIETNASHSRLHELFECTDHLIIDCKHTDNDTHLKWTGIDNHTILKNIKLAAEFHPSVHIRVPLIGGVNNSIEDMRNFVEKHKGDTKRK